MKSEMALKEALHNISITHFKGDQSAQIKGIVYDSRSVQKGDLFVAIKGEKTDGARFIQQAIEKGAAAIAAEQEIEGATGIAQVIVADARKFLAEISRVFYEDPTKRLKLAAITGTNGKTTTTYIIDSIFRRAGFPSCLIGTIEMKRGNKRFHAEHTTPESSDLLKFLRLAADEGCTHGSLEVSSHSLELKRVFGVKFTTGVFTNLTQDHLDFHKTMEAYYRAKLRLFAAESGNGLECGIINIDDPFGRRLEANAECPTISFGFDESAKIHPLECVNRADGTDLILLTPAGAFSIRMQLIGRPNVYNVMGAVGAALSLGLGLQDIKAGIEAMVGVPGRLQRVNAGQQYTVIVDYAHSPDALENLLHIVAQLPHKRILTVFGCGGDRDKTKRPIMGEIASKMSDLVFATSDNPRSEDPASILRDIEPGLRKGDAHCEIEPDRRAAIESAITKAEPGDVVVIAGKGHEDYQLIGGRTISFDDCKVAEELISKSAVRK